MEAFISLCGDQVFDLQLDSHLEMETALFSEGPDRAYLYLGSELAALWVVDSVEASQALAAGIAVPLPAGSSVRPFAVSWIKGGRLEVSRRPLGVDAALWLAHRLAAEDVLDHEAHLFGGHGVDEG